MSFSNGPATVTNGLVLALDAADKNSYPGSGTSWFDLSGNNNTGTLTNGPTFNTGSGGSIVFDGTNDFITGGLTTITSETKIIWFNGNNFLNSNKYLIDLGSNIHWIQVYLNKIRAGNSGGNFLDGNQTLTQNTWYCVAVTTDNISNKKIYINGILDAQTTLTNISFPTTYNIGRYGGNLNYNWGGNIANVQIYNRALTTSEILQNYNATKTRFGL